MLVDSTVCDLLNSLTSGHGSAFDPLHDRLIELGDPRVANLNIWLYDYTKNLAEEISYLPVEKMFAREFLHMAGISTSSILNRNAKVMHFPMVGNFTRSTMYGLPIREAGALILLKQAEIQARKKVYPDGMHGIFLDRDIASVPLGLMRETGTGMDSSSRVYDSAGKYIGQVCSGGHKHKDNFTFIAINVLNPES